MERIPFHVPSLEEQDLDAAMAVLRSGWITTGPHTREFEQRFAEHLGEALLPVLPVDAGPHAGR